MKKMKEPQIGDNSILMRRDRIKSTQREAPIPKRRIDCFGRLRILSESNRMSSTDELHKGKDRTR